MKSFSRLSLVLIFCIVLCSFTSISQEIPEITAEEFSDFTLNRNECFDGGSLWGYMNGGADIYLEYGFEKLRVEEFSNEDETIKLEIFKMDDPISAFGIYSIKTFKCEQSNLVTTTDCLNRFQFQLLYGNYYIQLINESGSENAKQTLISMAETLLKKLKPQELLLPLTYLTDSLNFSPSQINMVKGDLGVHNKAMYLEDSFNGIENYQIYYANTIVDGKKVKYYEIVFDKPEMKNKFLEKNKDKELQIIKGNDISILIQK
jgi:hypothetical protein